MTAVPSATFGRTKKNVSAPSHEVFSSSFAQAPSGHAIEALRERTEDYSFGDARKRDSIIVLSAEKSTYIPAPTKDGDSSSDNTAGPCFNWSMFFKLILKTALEHLSLITTPIDKHSSWCNQRHRTSPH